MADHPCLAPRGVSIVALFAYGAEEMRDRARETGCDAHVETLVWSEELLERIERHL